MTIDRASADDRPAPPTPLRILLAEDDQLLGQLLAAMLRAMGHEVCAIAATESDVVALTAQLAPQLIIADAWLGNGSGIAAVRQVLRGGPVAHLFISGDTGAIRLARHDAVVLLKPFDEAQLAAAIGAATQAV